jgi:hypothetical protein
VRLTAYAMHATLHPGMRTESVRQAAANNPSWYTAPYMDEGVRATEAALEHILQTCPQ